MTHIHILVCLIIIQQVDLGAFTEPSCKCPCRCSNPTFQLPMNKAHDDPHRRVVIHSNDESWPQCWTNNKPKDVVLREIRDRVEILPDVFYRYENEIESKASRSEDKFPKLVSYLIPHGTSHLHHYNDDKFINETFSTFVRFLEIFKEFRKDKQCPAEFCDGFDTPLISVTRYDNIINQLVFKTGLLCYFHAASSHPVLQTNLEVNLTQLEFNCKNHDNCSKREVVVLQRFLEYVTEVLNVWNKKFSH